MPHTLLLRLAGPMQSWGISSRFTIRDTASEPSKSGIVGMLCAALGRTRSEPVDDLAKLPMAVRVDREGTLKRDYHTAGGTHKKGEKYSVPTADGKNRRPVTSQRYYLADAGFIVGIESADPQLLECLDQALRRPHWTLCLGRKAFVPDPPVTLGVFDQPLDGILQTHPWQPRTQYERERILRDIDSGKKPALRIVSDSETPTHDVRCDVPVSFEQRIFANRYVQTQWLELTSRLVKED